MRQPNEARNEFAVKSLSDLSGALLKLRQKLELEQADMKMRIGMSQQQYQTIEAGGNTTIQTLLRVLEGLDAELVLRPKNKKIGLKISLNEFLNMSESEDSRSPLADEFEHLRDDDDVSENRG